MSIIATRKVNVKTTVSTRSGSNTARVRTTVSGGGSSRTTTKTVRVKKK